jgi:hypothetical protein
MLETILQTAAARKAMGLVGNRLIGSWKKRQGARESLELSKRRILSVRITNCYFPELTRLREIFVQHGLAERNDDNRTFFETWLSHPAVEMGWAPSGGWTIARIEALRSDLEKIRP